MSVKRLIKRAASHKRVTRGSGKRPMERMLRRSTGSARAVSTVPVPNTDGYQKGRAVAALGGEQPHAVPRDSIVRAHAPYLRAATTPVSTAETPVVSPTVANRLSPAASAVRRRRQRAISGASVRMNNVPGAASGPPIGMPTTLVTEAAGQGSRSDPGIGTVSAPTVRQAVRASPASPARTPRPSQVSVQGSTPIGYPEADRVLAAAATSYAPASTSLAAGPLLPVQYPDTAANTATQRGVLSGSGGGGGQTFAGTIHLDGNMLGQWVTRHLEQSLSLPNRGPTGVDPRVTPAWGSFSSAY